MIHSAKGRAIQMNAGGKAAQGETVIFHTFSYSFPDSPHILRAQTILGSTQNYQSLIGFSNALQEYLQTKCHQGHDGVLKSLQGHVSVVV